MDFNVNNLFSQNLSNFSTRKADGTVDKEALLKGTAALRQQLDNDGNGSLKYKEALPLLGSSTSLGQLLNDPRLFKLFADKDTKTLTEKSLALALLSADANKDGTLSLTEATAFKTQTLKDIRSSYFGGVSTAKFNAKQAALATQATELGLDTTFTPEAITAARTAQTTATNAVSFTAAKTKTAGGIDFEDLLKNAKTVVDTFDTNKDGVISDSEKDGPTGATLPTDPAEKAKYLLQMDIVKQSVTSKARSGLDGAVSATELAMEFLAIDANSDGKVSQSEWIKRQQEVNEETLNPLQGTSTSTTSTGGPLTRRWGNQQPSSSAVAAFSVTVDEDEAKALKAYNDRSLKAQELGLFDDKDPEDEQFEAIEAEAPPRNYGNYGGYNGGYGNYGGFNGGYQPPYYGPSYPSYPQTPPYRPYTPRPSYGGGNPYANPYGNTYNAYGNYGNNLVGGSGYSLFDTSNNNAVYGRGNYGVGNRSVFAGNPNTAFNPNGRNAGVGYVYPSFLDAADEG
jgi:Ca2+-binding EF-hand superfamily protein